MQAEQRVVVLSADLMDRSKIEGVFPHAMIVRSPAKLIEAAVDATLLIVDLAKLGDPTQLQGIDARIVGFGSHVKPEALAAAEQAGIEAVRRSVFFKRLSSGDL